MMRSDLMRSDCQRTTLVSVPRLYFPILLPRVPRLVFPIHVLFHSLVNDSPRLLMFPFDLFNTVFLFFLKFLLTLSDHAFAFGSHTRLLCLLAVPTHTRLRLTIRSAFVPA